MIRATIAVLLLLQQANAFSIAPSAKAGSALFSFKEFHYDNNDGIMMEQNGGVVPSKPCKPIKTVPSAVSRIKIEKPSDDQSEANHHDIYTVPSSMSKIERGTASDDQVENNHHEVFTVPSSMSRIERGPASDDQHDANFHTVRTIPSSMSKIERGPSNDSTDKMTTKALPLPTASIKKSNVAKQSHRAPFNGTTNFNKKSTIFERGQTDPYYE